MMRLCAYYSLECAPANDAVKEMRRVTVAPVNLLRYTSRWTNSGVDPYELVSAPTLCAHAHAHNVRLGYGPGRGKKGRIRRLGNTHVEWNRRG
jgi:hypothetical protein